MEQESASAVSSRLDMLQRTLGGGPNFHHIDGAFQPSLAGAVINVHNPATGHVLAEVATGDGEDIEMAVTAARRALKSGPWPLLTASQRAALLFALADDIEKDAADWALLESLDAGHTLTSITVGDLPLGLRSLRDNAGWATKVTGETAMQSAGQPVANYYVREAVGVAGLITPWNAPFLMAIQKMSAALAAGCTVVVKPSDLAPLSALRLGEACRRVGFPPGVVNVVAGGASAGKALSQHPDVNMISFTGSTDVGRSIMTDAANSNLKRVVLELGGKSPTVVFDDADIAKATSAIVAEIIFKSGQYCAAGTRVLVQRSIYRPFLGALRAQMEQVRTGAGHLSGSDMGPMISQHQRERAARIVGDSVQQGATVICGGRPKTGPGYFFEPTILVNAGAEARAWREEIFAPVLTLTPFPDDAPLEQVAAAANDTRYGLSAKVWSRDLRRVLAMIDLFETGQVIANGGGGEAVLPFGGIKLSGYGRENGLEGVKAFTEIKSVKLGY